MSDRTDDLERQRQAARRFTWQAGDVTPSQCAFCRHWQQGRCAAFPNGVPMAILANRHDHTTAYPGDRGIRFAPRSTEAGERQVAIFAPKAPPDRG